MLYIVIGILLLFFSVYIGFIFYVLRNNNFLNGYYIGWEDKKAMMFGYVFIKSKNPDDAMYKFRCKYYGKHIIICSENQYAVINRMYNHPWNNGFN